MSDDLNHITTAIDGHFYRLVDRVPVPCTLAEFAESMKDDANRIVAQTMVKEMQVSSIFTGINTNWGKGAPVLFETAVFGLPDDLRPQWSLSSWDETMETHKLLVDMLTEHGPEPLIQEIHKKIAG